MAMVSSFRLVALLLLATGLVWSARAQSPAPLPPLRGYLNAHDPSTIIECNNRYYIFSTGQGILSKSSADKIFWVSGPPVFTNPPAWTMSSVPGFTGLFWAPDVLYFNNQYHLYYAVSTFGSQVSGIGLVTSPTLDPADPAYHWADQGPVIGSTNGSPYNTIDPSLTWDNAGNLWMAFGSYWNGIYLVQLNASSGLRISPNSTTCQLAYNSSIEASYLWRRGGYYYLFVNWGSCCDGVHSTYNIRVGRSTSVTGPYLDRNGVNMAVGGGTLFMQANGKYTGPGHIGILSEGGRLSLTHHYYDANAWAPQYGAYGAPDFALLPLDWTPDDWPVVANDWSAIYDFQADARDENSQYYGLLQGGATTVPDSTYGKVLNLNGTNQYVWLPPGAGYAKAFVAVVKWRGGDPWQRIFDFGVDTSKTVMLTPASGDNVLRCDLNPGGDLQTIQWTKPLPTNAWTQVAVTFDGSQAILYVNGASVVTNSTMNLLPANVAPQTNHLGRSKFVADPYFNGQFASFRAYGRTLSPAEIAAPMPAITLPAADATCWPGTLLTFAGSATDFLNRPLGANALTWQINYVLDGNTNVVFGPMSGIAGGSYNIPASSTGGGIYVILLTATDAQNRQATVSSTVRPAHEPAGWASYYPLQSDTTDANGHYNGTLQGGAGFVNDVTRGSVLNLNGTNQFVRFPPGLAGMKTFMAWVKWNGGAPWQRIYDFGNDTNRYTVLTPLAANGRLRFNISVDSIAGEQIVDAPAALPANIWTHVAVVQDGTGTVLYTNGTPVATNAFANLLPANLNATNLYLGKSQWPDPYFSGQLSSVRIFSSALSASEIVAPQISINQPAEGAVYHSGDTVAFAGNAQDFYDATIAASGLTWAVNFVNAGVTNCVLGPVSGVVHGSFSIPAVGAAATNGFYQVTLVATDVAGRAATNAVNIYPAAAATPANWSSYYPFTSGAQDASNRFNGTFRNGASIVSDLVRGNVLGLQPSASQYVNLPAGAGAAQTVSGWVKWNGGGDWQRIFDFGQNPGDFFFLTPSDGAGLPQCAITPQSDVYVQMLESPVTIPVGQWIHVAVVMDGREGILYLNGNAVAVNNSVNLLPSDLAPTNCYFGKSQFPADPKFNGRLSAMRLNSGAVPLARIIAPQPVISQPLGGALFAGGSPINFAGAAADYSGAPLPPNAFVWTGEFHSNDVAAAAFGPLTGVTNGSYFVTANAAVITNIFYRVNLVVTDTNGNQSAASADIEPKLSQLTFDTVPTGLPLALDGMAFTTPVSLAMVVGMNHSIVAPSPQVQSGTNYQFVVWSDGGAAAHVLTVPATNAIFIASYVPPVLVAQTYAGELKLSWPQWAGSMNLYSTADLRPPVVWLPVAITPVITNGWINIQIPATNGNMFYHLQLP